MPWPSRRSTPPGPASADVRAVLDPNVLISAILSPTGAPARALFAWVRGEFELVVSRLLLDELERALAYPKLRARIPVEDAIRFVAWLAGSATLVSDPEDPPAIHSEDPGDDYLIALAAVQRAVLVSGDAHLLEFEGDIPVLPPARFVLEHLSA